MNKSFEEEVNDYLDKFSEEDGRDLKRIKCTELSEDLYAKFNAALSTGYFSTLELVEHPDFTLLRGSLIYRGVEMPVISQLDEGLTDETIKEIVSTINPFLSMPS